MCIKDVESRTWLFECVIQCVYQCRFKLGEIFNNLTCELIKTCEVMWTTLGIEIRGLLFTDLFCLLCSFIVIYSHWPPCTNSSCFLAEHYFKQIFSFLFSFLFFVKYVFIFLHQKTIWFSPIDEAWYDLYMCSPEHCSIHFSIHTNGAQSSHFSFLSASVTNFLLSLAH